MLCFSLSLCFLSSLKRLDSLYSIWLYGSVLNIFLKISFLSLVSQFKSFLKSPCAIIAICENWFLSTPKISSILAVTSFVFETTVPFGKIRVAFAPCFAKPSPLLLLRKYSGFLVTLYISPLYSNSSSTYVFVSSLAYFERKEDLSRISPLALP